VSQSSVSLSEVLKPTLQLLLLSLLQHAFLSRNSASGLTYFASVLAGGYMADAQGANGAAASVPQIAPLAKYKLVFLGDQVQHRFFLFRGLIEPLAL